MPRPVTPTPAPTITVESTGLTLEVLEGKLQYKTPDSDWLDAIDGMPIEQGWSVRTLAVSTGVVHFPDESKVLLSPTTELKIELYETINGGPPSGERHARIAVVDGEIDFDVTPAASPPNTWIFITADGAVTIQGTRGTLKRRVTFVEGQPPGGPGGPFGPGIDPSVKVEFGLILLDGAATIARLNAGAPPGQAEIEAAVIQAGVEFNSDMSFAISADQVAGTGPGPANTAVDHVKFGDIARAMGRQLEGPPTPPGGGDPGNFLKELQTVALGGAGSGRITEIGRFRRGT